MKPQSRTASLVRAEILFWSILDRGSSDVYDFIVWRQSEDKGGKLRRFDKSNGRKSALIKLLVLLFLLITMSIAWRWTPLREFINFETVIRWQGSLKDYPAALLWVVVAYLVGGLVLFPVTILNIATVITFGPIIGNAYAVSGWLFSASMSFGIGRKIGSEALHKIARYGLNRILHQAGRHGFLTVLSMRILPVAPFTIVNLIIGASGIRFHDFLLASLVGRIPGIVTLTLFGVQLENFLREPGSQSLALLAVTLLLMLLVTTWLYKHFASYDERRRTEL
jgi:phospholipase D1/2